MATIGQALTTPETGWRRYDDTDSRFQYTGNWNTVANSGFYNSTQHYTLIYNSSVKFKFYGSKLRIISSFNNNRDSNISINIDGTTFNYSQYNSTEIKQCLLFEKTDLSLDTHTVIITKVINGNTYTDLDAIDIDAIGYLAHPTLNQVSDINLMQIGDCIPCRYTASTSGSVGYFSELGLNNVPDILTSGSATPDGLFYFIKTDKGTLVADRNIQTGISWDKLNSSKYITGKTNLYDWTFIDGGNTTGLNYNTSQNATLSNLCVYNGNLYCAWYEGATGQIRIKKYDGISWVFIDGNSTTGLNYDTTKSAMNPNLCVYNNELYCAWYEIGSNGYYQIRVKKWNDTIWTFIDGNSINGLNYTTSQSASNPNLCVYNGNLYCCWREYINTGYYQIRVKKYDGSSWAFVDGNGSNGINYSTSKSALYPILCVYNNNLYCTWNETNGMYNQIRIKMYDGTSWIFVDGNTSTGINYSASCNAQYPNLCAYNNELYCIWQEVNVNGYNQIRMKKYNGTTWNSIDGNSAYGLNYNTSRDAFNPKLYVYNNELYCAWYEAGTGQIMIKKWNGTWTPMDGCGSYGLNYDTTKSAQYPNLCVYNGNLYYNWQETNGSYIQIRTMKSNFVIGTFHSLLGGESYTTPTGNSSLIDNGLGAWPNNNEWDTYIVNSTLNGCIIAGDDNIWHYKSIYSWCKESTQIGTWTPLSGTAATSANTSRILRGGNNLSAWQNVSWLLSSNSATSAGTIGFRPVLSYVENNLKSKYIY